MRYRRIRSGYACAIAALLAIALVACGGTDSDSSSGGNVVDGGNSGTPTPDFSASTTTPDTNTTVVFTDLSPAGATQWNWDFNNDGTVDTSGQNPSHVYATPGTYTVRLTVNWPEGANTATKVNYITVTAAPVGTADIDADTNRDGTITDGTDDANEDTWNATQGAVFYFNLDDDDNNNQEDYKDTTSTGADNLDLAQVIVRQSSASATDTARVLVSTPAQGRIRVFRNSGSWTQVYVSGSSFTLPIADVIAGDVTLGIEARERLSPSWNGQVTLTLELRDSGNALLSSDAVILRCAPPLFATNLWETSEYNLVNVGNGTYGNQALRSAMQSICTAGGITYREASGPVYNYDRWLQDSSEPAVVQLPSATGPRRVIDYVFQCARWRECDDFCEDVLWGPDYDFMDRFSTNTNSHNYGGNLEVIPPYTGKPWGQIVFGGGTGFKIGTSQQVTSRMTAVYRDFFTAAQAQGPWVEITSEWLAVGHIDEFSMFIPAPNTPRGWVCLIASPDRARQVLQDTQTAGHGSATVFAGRGSQTTVSAILLNSSLETLNNEVQTRIDYARTQIKNATNLTDADFIEVPVLFENVGSNYMAAYNPGVVNLVCMPASNGTTYLAIPDPEGPDIGGVDQWQADINAQLAALDTAANPYDIRYVDVFHSYHELLGEAHCGSNTTRVPPSDDWWDK